MQSTLLHTVWNELVACGPRFMGTEGADNAVRVITQHLRRLELDVQLHRFQHQAWLPGQSPLLTIADRQREAFVMLGSKKSTNHPPTLKGKIKYIGPFGIWDRYDWQRFAVVGPNGDIVAYLMGRTDGPAIPQALPVGIDDTPYVGIGMQDVNELLHIHNSGSDVSAELVVNPTQVGMKEGTNIAVDLPGQGDQFVLIGAHYDSLYSTPGAYDNASGAACLMALAEQLREGVPGLRIRLVWFGAEEWLLAGSNAYVDMLRQQDQLPDFMINIDGVGRGDTLEIWYGPDQLLHSLRSTLGPELQKLAVNAQYIFPPPAGSDHAAFYNAGSAVCMLTFNDLEILHRPEDTIDEAKMINMTKMLKAVTALIESRVNL